ncbi:MAG: hypothetical protein ACK56K_04630 [Akkermansiaceae bacterium]
MAKQLYGYLPRGKTALREIRNNSRKYIQMAGRAGSPEARETLKPYKLKLYALGLAARKKLAAKHTETNCRNWDRRAYRFYQELQQNLGKLTRIHFLTLTFAGNPTYEHVRKLLRDLTKNQLYRAGLESVRVISFHPEKDSPGRLHVHMLAWSKDRARSLQAQEKIIQRILKSKSCARSGIGFTECRSIKGVAEFVKASAYMAWNYSRTIKLAKGPNNPIPKGARVLSRPQRCRPNKAWVTVGQTLELTPAKNAWRKAISSYARAHGSSRPGDLRWIWRERRHIREFLCPEEWAESSFTGLDGYIYQVMEACYDYHGNEVYRVESEDERSFYLTERALEKVAMLQILANSLPKNNSLDFTTGKTANYNEMLGLYARMPKDVFYESDQ